MEVHASNKTVKLDVSDGDDDVYGVKECEAVLVVASKMPGIQESGMDFDPKVANSVRGTYSCRIARSR